MLGRAERGWAGWLLGEQCAESIWRRYLSLLYRLSPIRNNHSPGIYIYQRAKVVAARCRATFGDMKSPIGREAEICLWCISDPDYRLLAPTSAQRSALQDLNPE